jgi:hypothetical protein
VSYWQLAGVLFKGRGGVIKMKNWLNYSKGLLCLIIILVLVLNACTSAPAPAPTPSPGEGGTVVRSDSLITGEIRAIRQQPTGYPWEIDVLIQSSNNVDSLPNPTSDKVGQVVTAQTDEDLSSFNIGETIKARIKYVGDVPEPGISLYIYNIAVTSAQTKVEIGPAPIHDVKIALTQTNSQELLVYVKGGLRDTCTTFHDLNTERNGNSISINITVQTITGQICDQVYKLFERRVNLGGDFVSGEVYVVTVNDNPITFTMP